MTIIKRLRRAAILVTMLFALTHCRVISSTPSSTVPPATSPTAVALLITHTPVATNTLIPSPTATPPPTQTPIPTATPLPTETLTPTSTATPSLTPTLTPEPLVHLAAVGDIMLGRTLGNIIASGNITYPFAAVSDWLTQPDITVGNVESALGDIGEPYPDKVYTFQAPVAAAEALAVGGFDIVSLANNHGMDYGPEALLQSIELLRAQNIAPIGAGANRTEARMPHIVTINGVTLAFLAYVQVSIEPNGFTVESWDATESTAGLAWARPDEVEAEVAAVAPDVDHVIVVLHSGIEYLPPPSEEQQALVDAALAGGATLIIGHHAHILQGLRYDNQAQTLVAYGLGNFAFDIDGDPSSAVLHVWLTPDGVSRVEMLPAIIQVGGAPRPAQDQEIEDILQRIGRQSRGWPFD